MIAKLASSTSVHQTSRSSTLMDTSNMNGPNQRSLSASFVANTIASSQSKKKRAKILDLLLNTNWSKQSQQASQILKLNKLLLVCDANFIDEKTGESPLSLIVSSQQINYPQTPNHLTSTSTLLHIGSQSSCTQSASLFNLQAVSATNHTIHSSYSNASSSLLTSQQQQNSQMLLQQTNVADLAHSKAPLVERLILLFVKSGAQINFANLDKRTALHMAAIKSNLWAIKTLLELGKFACAMNNLLSLLAEFDMQTPTRTRERESTIGCVQCGV